MSELINYYSPWNYQRPYGFLMISVGLICSNLVNFRSKICGRSRTIVRSWKFCILILIWVVFLGVPFAKGVGSKITSCLKLVRIMLKTWNLVHKYTHVYSLRKYSTKTPLILLMSAFCKNCAFLFAKIAFLLEAIVWELY